ELEEDEASAERLAVVLVRHPPLDGVVLRAPAAGQGAERRHGDERRAGRRAGPRGGASPAEGQGRVHGPYLVRDASRAEHPRALWLAVRLVLARPPVEGKLVREAGLLKDSTGKGLSK